MDTESYDISDLALPDNGVDGVAGDSQEEVRQPEGVTRARNTKAGPRLKRARTSVDEAKVAKAGPALQRLLMRQPTAPPVVAEVEQPQAQEEEALPQGDDSENYTILDRIFGVPRDSSGRPVGEVDPENYGIAGQSDTAGEDVYSTPGDRPFIYGAAVPTTNKGRKRGFFRQDQDDDSSEEEGSGAAPAAAARAPKRKAMGQGPIDVVQLVNEPLSLDQAIKIVKRMGGQDGPGVLYKIGDAGETLSGWQLAMVLQTLAANGEDLAEFRKRIVRASAAPAGLHLPEWVTAPARLQPIDARQFVNFLTQESQSDIDADGIKKRLIQPALPLSPMAGRCLTTNVELESVEGVAPLLDIVHKCDVDGQAYTMTLRSFLALVRQVGQETTISSATVRAVVGKPFERVPYNHPQYLTRFQRLPPLNQVVSYAAAVYSSDDPEEKELGEELREVLVTHAQTAGTPPGLKGRLLNAMAVRAKTSIAPSTYQPGRVLTAFNEGNFNWKMDEYLENIRLWFPFTRSQRTFKTISTFLLEAAYGGILPANGDSDAGLDHFQTKGTPGMLKKNKTILTDHMRATMLLKVFENFATAGQGATDLAERWVAGNGRTLTTMAGKSKFEVLTTEKMHTKSRIIYVCQNSNVLPLAMLMQGAVPEHDFHYPSLLGFSPFKGGMFALLADADEKIRQYGYAIYIFCDNMYLAYKAGQYIYWISLDGEAQECSARRSCVEATIQRLLKEMWGVELDEASSDQLSEAWVLYARTLGPALGSDSPAVFGSAVIDLIGMGSGFPGTAIVNNDFMARVGAYFLGLMRATRKGAKFDLRPYSTPVKMSMDVLVHDSGHMLWESSVGGPDAPSYCVTYDNQAEDAPLKPGKYLAAAAQHNGMGLKVERVMRVSTATLTEAAERWPLQLDLLGFATRPLQLIGTDNKYVVSCLERDRLLTHMPFTRVMPKTMVDKVAMVDRWTNYFLSGGAATADTAAMILSLRHQAIVNLGTDGEAIAEATLQVRQDPDVVERTGGAKDLAVTLSKYANTTMFAFWDLQLGEELAIRLSLWQLMYTGGRNAIALCGIAGVKKLMRFVKNHRDQVEDLRKQLPPALQAQASEHLAEIRRIGQAIADSDETREDVEAGRALREQLRMLVADPERDLLPEMPAGHPVDDRVSTAERIRREIRGSAPDSGRAAAQASTSGKPRRSWGR